MLAFSSVTCASLVPLANRQFYSRAKADHLPFAPHFSPLADRRAEMLHICDVIKVPLMSHLSPSFRHRIKIAKRRTRELAMIGRALASTDHPVMAHIIPMRRCNLSCAYCNEYDDFSKPVPVQVMYERIEKLHSLGTNIITISGGEPLLHPDLDLIIARIRRCGIIAG